MPSPPRGGRPPPPETIIPAQAVAAPTPPCNFFDRSNPGLAFFSPPKVTPPPQPLSLPKFLVRFISNPLGVLPEAVYHEPIFQYRLGPNTITWVTDPDLIKAILLDRREQFPKTPLERRALGPLFGNGILTSGGG